MATKARQPVKTLNKDANTVAANAAAEKARKAASKAALEVQALRDMAKAKYDEDEGVMFETYDTTAFNEAIATSKTAKAAWALHMKAMSAIKETQAVYEVEDHAAEYAANAVKAATVDAEALGVPVEQVLADMGLNVDGTPTKPIDSKAKYQGPMLALRTAALTYVTAKNGQPCNGDPLALLCGQYSRTEVVVGLIKAMALPGNPYFHLNPGQQSMNLRNKARAQITKGLLTLAQVEAALKA